MSSAVTTAGHVSWWWVPCIHWEDVSQCTIYISQSNVCSHIFLLYRRRCVAGCEGRSCYYHKLCSQSSPQRTASWVLRQLSANSTSAACNVSQRVRHLHLSFFLSSPQEWASPGTIVGDQCQHTQRLRVTSSVSTIRTHTTTHWRRRGTWLRTGKCDNRIKKSNKKEH